MLVISGEARFSVNEVFTGPSEADVEPNKVGPLKARRVMMTPSVSKGEAKSNATLSTADAKVTTAAWLPLGLKPRNCGPLVPSNPQFPGSPLLLPPQVPEFVALNVAPRIVAL